MKDLNTVMQELPERLPKAIIKVARENAGGLPDPDQVSYYVLESERILYLDKEIDESDLDIQRMILRWNLEDTGIPPAQRKPITLLISSPGGDADCMWCLADTIEASETPVRTVVAGMAASAAGIIYLAGHTRMMFRRSKLLIHEGSAHLAGDALKVMDAGDNYRAMLKQMKDYILEKTSISPAALNRQRGHDWILDAPYCLEHGACDRIVEHISDLM